MGPQRSVSSFATYFEMASRTSSKRRKHRVDRNTQSSNKDTEYGKKNAEVTNVDVQQCIPNTGPFTNDVEQCIPACPERPKSKMESRSTEQESLIGYRIQNFILRSTPLS